jgi:hypothetical protein
MRYFNTAGPVRCEEHYCLPPLTRISLDEVLMLIDQRKYFVLQWEEKIFHRSEAYQGTPITVWGM